jgi:hypothetical protein
MRGHVFKVTDDQGEIFDYLVIATGDPKKAEYQAKAKVKASGEKVELEATLNDMDQWKTVLKDAFDFELREGSSFKLSDWVA